MCQTPPSDLPHTHKTFSPKNIFRAQPAICQFNVLMLGKAFVLAGLLDGEGLQEVVDSFTVALSGAFSDAMRRKLGLRDFDPGLYGDLMALMIQDKPDFTNTWRALSSVAPGDGAEGLTPALAAALGEDLAQVLCVGVEGCYIMNGLVMFYELQWDVGVAGAERGPGGEGGELGGAGEGCWT